MDPNMNQNNQITLEPQMMNPQEVSQAQVLNYDDVNSVAAEESKSTSLKKIAFFFLLIGIILLGGGVFYKLNPADEQTAPPSGEKAIDTNKDKASTCTLNDEQATTNLVKHLTYTFNYDENNTLQSYTKDYSASTILENVQSDIALDEEIKTMETFSTNLTTKPITGYSMNVTPPTETDGVKTLNVKIVIDLVTLDPNQLTDELKGNSITQVDLTKGLAEPEVASKLTSVGYVCQ